MTADPTYPSPARVATASELDALPVGTIVRGRSGMLSRGNGTLGPTWYHYPSRDHAADSGIVAEVEGSVTVLFRPDAPQPRAEDGCVDRDWHAEAHARGDRLNALVAALHDAFAGRAHDGGFAAGIRGLLDENDRLRRDAPQPATDGEDAVERAARAMQAEHASRYPDEPGSYTAGPGQPVWRHLARAALAAARAGEAEPGETVVQQQITVLRDGYAVPQVRTARFGPWCDPDAPAAQRGGEAVDREDFGHPARGRGETYEPPTGAHRVIHRARNSLHLRATHEQRKETVRELIDALDAVLDARGDAAPTEVEWGVEEDDGDWTIFAEALNPHARDDAEEWARLSDTTLMQRTVSAWREARP